MIPNYYQSIKICDNIYGRLNLSMRKDNYMIIANLYEINVFSMMKKPSIHGTVSLRDQRAKLES